MGARNKTDYVVRSSLGSEVVMTMRNGICEKNEHYEKKGHYKYFLVDWLVKKKPNVYVYISRVFVPWYFIMLLRFSYIMNVC